MHIEYELKFRDYLAFNTLHQLLSVPTQLFYGGLAAFIFYTSLSDESILVSAIMGVLAYIAMWAVQLMFNVIYLYVGKNRSLLTKHTVEIQDEAFYNETRFSRSYYYWPGIAKVVLRSGFVAVYINAHSAHIVPSRAFSSREQCQLFLSSIKEKLGAA